MHPKHLYVHVPFCARRCAYCDFSIAVRRDVPVDDYLEGLRAELDTRFARTTEPWHLDTLYFGGGTPSRLGVRLADAIELVRQRATLSPGAEVTIEVNPEDVTPTAVAAWRAAGVNRLSLGAQSFDDTVLRWMHRVHDAERTRQAVETARAGGIADLSLDLIFALPESLGRDWDRDLTEALALEPQHVSLYGLTVEPHTPLGRWRARGQVIEAPEEGYEREFLRAHERLVAAGFEHYEVSNYGRPGHRARHNSAYWTGASYAGVGPSAHEFDGDERRWNVSAYTDWLDRARAGADPLGGSERLTDDDRVAERVYLGLRTDTGLPLEGTDLARVERWTDAGWGSVTGDGRLVLSAAGWLRLDALAADLTLVRSRY